MKTKQIEARKTEPLQALHFLLHPLNNHLQGTVQSQQIQARIIRHPFGLKIPLMEANDRGGRSLYFLGSGDTSSSVKAMLQQLCVSLAVEAPAQLKKNLYLRVIYAIKYPSEPNNHDVYFEFGDSLSVYLCGGCTDCSGEGGWGRLRLETIFDLVAQVYRLEVERVEATCEQWGVVKEYSRGIPKTFFH
mgnify:CR=1 FL=1